MTARYRLRALPAWHRSIVPGPARRALLCALLAGCSQGDNPEFFGAAPAEAPRPVEAAAVDVDGGGIGEGDIVLVRFDRDVVLSGEDTAAFVTRSLGDSLGDGAVLRQSRPASRFVEIVLGEDATLVPGAAGTPGVTRINLAEDGAPPVESARDGFRAAAADSSLVLADVTSSAPELVEVLATDSDNSGTITRGDRLVISFDKPVSVPAGVTVAANFDLPVAGDSFGASPLLAAASEAENNRSVIVTLGSGAALTLEGTFASGATGAGSPSGLRVLATATITDTVGAAPHAIAAGSTDIEVAAASTFGRGREAETVLGKLDAFTPAVTAAGLSDPSDLDFYSGTLTVGGVDFDVDLLFVADRENDRVLVFADFPSSSFASASWVVGQPDLESGPAGDPADPEDPEPAADRLDGPAGVAFDAGTNRLFVSDTGHHRILVWLGLFQIDADTGDLTVPAGAPASFALGQASLTEGEANRGRTSPSRGSLSSPGGLHAAGGVLAAADTGNHRVLLYGSLPASASALPGVVLGQADFISGEANRGGAVSARSMRSPADVFVSADLSINGSSGAVLVADTDNHRVLVFEGATPSNGVAADLALGQANLTSAAAVLSASGLDSPAGVTADPTGGSERIYVADRGNHRVVTYDASGALASGDAGTAIGQANATSGDANRGGAPGAETLNGPQRVVIAGSALVVADSGNHRVLAYQGAALPQAHRDATLVLGQSAFTAAARGGQRLGGPVDVLVVRRRLVVSDTANHRVLVYAPPPLSGDPDPVVVLGQPDLYSTQPNRGGTPSRSTLHSPTYLASDGKRLVVADTGNHRLLLWSSLPQADGEPADVVLGQADPADRIPNAGEGPLSRTFHAPEGVAMGADRLFVADRENHRVLVFEGIASLGDFGRAALVLGQTDFVSREPNRGGAVSRATLKAPRAVLFGAGRLYVADTGNSRVLVWDGLPEEHGEGADGLFGQASFDAVAAAPASAMTLLEPAGLALDVSDSYLVVADTGHHRVVLFDRTDGRGLVAPEAGWVLGQAFLSAGEANRGLDAPGGGTLRSPRGVFYSGYELAVADTGNARVVLYR